VLDAQPVWLRAVESILQDGGFLATSTSAPEDALTLVAHEDFDVLMVGVDFGKDFDWALFLEKIGAVTPKSKRIVVSVGDDPKVIQQALDLGADAYIVKRAEPDDLVFAVRQVLSPEVYHVRTSFEGTTKARFRASKVAKPTPREREIARLVAQGRSNAEIAKALAIREATVKGHLWRLYRKIGVSNRTVAARWIDQIERLDDD
jgi:DNA-binding NarL/FixJ family response regulator